VLLGCHTAKIDEKGRLKIPTAFKATVEERHGTAGLFVTSIRGDFVRIYPMPVWLGLQERLSKMAGTHPSKAKFLRRASYFGQLSEFDVQGRVLIPSRLRESAAINGEVAVIGQVEYIDVWNNERFAADLDREPFTDDDYRALAEFGI
jgi:MraZ protein